MSLSKKTRRELLKLGIGVGAMGLIDKLGLPLVSSRKTYAGYGPGSGKPTKLLTIYVPGGWSGEYIWCPLSKPEIQEFMSPYYDPYEGLNTPAFYNWDMVDNVDGTGNALDDGGFQRLRVPRVWDEKGLLAKTGWNKYQTSGWSWGNPEWKIWEHCNVVSGINTGAAGHRAALVGMLCGISNATFIVPSIHARVAHAMAAVYGDNRPLGNVTVGPDFTTNIFPSAGTLPAVAAPLHLKSLSSLKPLFSDEYKKYETEHWYGLRNRAEHDDFNYAGEKQQKKIKTNDMEEYVLKNLRTYSGSPNDVLFQQIHDSYRAVSTQLAADITSVIQNSPGLNSCVIDKDTNKCALDENGKPIPLVTKPYWANHKAFGHFHLPYQYNAGVEGYAQLALQLLTSDLCSSIQLIFGDEYHDNHRSLPSGIPHYKSMIQIHEQIGRMLAYMTMLPGASGGTLLDETLVLVCSEFNRTLASSGTCGHWPVDFVCFAGGNVHGNRMLGGLETEGKKQGVQGLYGKPTQMIDESDLPMTRRLERMDIAHSALHIMGLPNTFLPGGPGRIVGLSKEGV